MSAGNPGALQGWCFSPIGSRWGKFGPLSVLQREASTHRHKVQAWKVKINRISRIQKWMPNWVSKGFDKAVRTQRYPIVNLVFQAWFALQQTCIDQGQQIWNGQKGHGSAVLLLIEIDTHTSKPNMWSVLEKYLFPDILVSLACICYNKDFLPHSNL